MAKSKHEDQVLANLDKVERWYAEGATHKEVADRLHLGYSTIKHYLAEARAGNPRYTDFLAAYERACEVADDQVEAALHKRACGITWTEKTWERKVNEETGEVELVLVKQVEKYIAPDARAAEFWLTNRKKNNWKSRAEETRETDREVGVVMMPEVDSG